MIALNEAIAKYGTDKINSMTKYPSILTYHDLGQKGCLLPTLVEEKHFGDEDCYVTEKIDGTNSRIVIWGDDYIIGSREQLLYAKGDRFGDPSLNIVHTVKPYAQILSQKLRDTDKIYIIYGETYGGKVTARSKQYTNDQTYHYRIFDICVLEEKAAESVLSKEVGQISSWKEHGGQTFYDVEKFKKAAEDCGLDRVPYIEVLNGKKMPTALAEVYEWLLAYSETKAGINYSGKAEGVVVRTFDRSLIRKIRFEDYEKTKKRIGF